MPLAAAQDADACHTETSANSAQEMPSSSKADQRQASAMSATSESSSAASSDLVELRAGGMADGHAAYELVRRAASEPSAEFWEMWASRELHWFHASLGAWLSQSADGGWTGWTMDGLPTILGSWQPWEVAVDASEAPHVRWFCGAQTNAAFNEVDRHVLRGHGGEVAFVAESPSGETTHVTRRWLLLHSVLIAHAVRDGLRVTAPQRIALYRRRVRRRPLPKERGLLALPRRNTDGHRLPGSQPLAHLTMQVYAKHATRGGVDRGGQAARRAVRCCGSRHRKFDLGRQASPAPFDIHHAFHTAQGSDLVLCRLADTGASVLVTSRALLEVAAAAVAALPQPPTLVLADSRENGVLPAGCVEADALLRSARDAVFDGAELECLSDTQLLAAAWKHVPPTPVESSWPLFVLYTSGSTGKPKGIVHTHGGYQVGLCATVKLVFDLLPESDLICVVATAGWITGQSYMIAAPLLCRVPSVLLDGSPTSPPDRIAGVISRHRATVLKAGSTF